MSQSLLRTPSTGRRTLGTAITVAISIVVAALAVRAAYAADNDRTIAEQAIAAVERNPSDAALAGDSLKQAKAALSRAHDMHAASDHAHAALLERVAREWAETAGDVVRAAAAEKRAAQFEVDANDAEQKALRAQALIEETLARRNRAKERLDQMQTDAKNAAAPAKSMAPAKPPVASGAGKAAPKKAAPTPAPGSDP